MDIILVVCGIIIGLVFYFRFRNTIAPKNILNQKVSLISEAVARFSNRVI